MASGYTRQSAANIASGQPVTSAPVNNEYNQLVSAFSGTSGHDHSGGTGLGPQLGPSAFATLSGLSTGILVATSPTSFTTVTVTGTAGKITVTNGSGVAGNPTLTIDATYIGQSSITTLGTIGTGVWQGTVVGVTYGGTGANLSATGGASQVLKQTSSGGVISVGQLAASDLSNGNTGSGLNVLQTSPTLITPVLGVATATSINGLAITTSTGTLTIANLKTVTHNATTTFGGTDGKTVAFNASLTFAGTDATTLTFQGTDTYVGRATTDTFTNKTYNTAGTGNVFQINGTGITAVNGTGAVSLTTNVALVTPNIGVATATTLNGLTITASTGTLNITNLKTVAHTATTTFAGVDGKTLTINNSLTLAGTDATTLTFQGTDTYVGRATTDTLTNKTYDTAGAGNSFKINGTAITSISGNTAKVATTSGALTSTHLAAFDVSGNIVDGGVGTVPGYTLLSAVAASGAASVVFSSSVITATYDNYLIVCDSVLPGTGSVNFFALFSANNGGSYFGASYDCPGFAAGTGGSGASTTSAAANLDLLSGQAVVTTATQPTSGQINIRNVNTTTGYVQLFADMVVSNGGASFGRAITAGRYTGATGAINNIKLLMSSGNISGNFYLYGIRKV